jgi:hypothetical protein
VRYRVFYEPSGRVRWYTGIVGEAPTEHEGLLTLDVDAPPPRQCYVDGGELKAMPDPPADPAGLEGLREWDYAAKQWGWAPQVKVARRLRRLRRRKLAATDWTQGVDIAPEVREQWAAYRQALRDIPQQPGFPYDISWPEPPE